MADQDNAYIIHDVTALYPRLNQTYRFDRSIKPKGRSVPCEPTEDGAKYEMNFQMTKAQAVPLYKAMKDKYNAAKHDSWDEFPKPEEVFEVQDGVYTAETNLKGAFGGKLTSIKQFDAQNKPLPSDFMLTTGSTVNLLFVLVPYEPRSGGCGVSLRLRQVQVVKLAELVGRSAFEVIEGGFNSQSDGFATDFKTVEDTAPEDELEDKPVAVEPKAVAKAKTETKSVDEYNDIDEALDDLEFEVA